MSKLKKVFGIVSGLVGIAAALLYMFLPMITMEGDTDTYSGVQVMFGYSESAMGITIETFKFSIMALIVAILFLAGAFLLISNIKKGAKMVSLVGGVILIVASIMSFMSNLFVVPSDLLQKMVDAGMVKFVLASGPVVASVMGIIAGAMAGVSALLKG